MFVARGSIWGPSPLPDFLRDQLDDHGFTADDAGRCARLINERRSGAGTASLFVDLGSCKFLEGDIDGAMAAWRHVVSGPHDAAAARGLLNLGLLYEHLELYDRALGLFDAVTARDVDPHVVPAAMASARCAVAIGEVERAMEIMARLAQRTMAKNPDGPELIATLFGLGEVAEHAGRHDRAERAWRVAAASPPSDVQRAARDRLITMLVDRSRLGEAVEVDERVPAGATSGSPAVSIELAMALAATGDGAGAKHILASVDVAGAEPAVAFRLVDARRRCRMVNESIDVLEVLLRNPDREVELRAACLLGEIYESFDMAAPARSVLQRALSADHPFWTPRARQIISGSADSPDESAAVAPADRRVQAMPSPEPVTSNGVYSDPQDHSTPAPDEPDEPDEVDDLDVFDEPDTLDADPIVDLRDPVVVTLEADRAPDPTPSNGASAFVDHVEDGSGARNPYAALAPDESADTDVVRANNPYAELAPGFDDSDFVPAEDIEPGDWESMLGDWEPPPEKKRSKAFSRYT